MDSKSKTHGEFAAELGMSRTTLWRRLKPHGFSTKQKLLNPREQKKIKELLDYLEERPAFLRTSETI